MYIRRKVFSIIEVEGEERLFSVTELEQKEFGAHKRKQNRKLERSLHNAEMHANRAAKAEAKASKIVSNPLNLVDENKMAEAENLAKKSQKAAAASKHSAKQAADTVKNISKTRKSVNADSGLNIKNQGGGDINIGRDKSGSVTATRYSNPKSGNSRVKVVSTPTNNLDISKKSTGTQLKKTNISVSTPKQSRLQSVNDIEKRAKRLENISKKVGNNVKKSKNVIAKNSKLIKGLGIGATALALGGLGYKAIKKEVEEED